MWKQKIGISLERIDGLSDFEVIDIVAATGFDAVSPLWRNGGKELFSLVEYARSRGLTVQSMHAPFSKSADMWSEGERAQAALRELIRVVEDCAELKIPVLVCHVWKGFEYTEVPCDAGIQNYGSVVARAKELGVKIAFENTEGEEFLYALMEHFEDEETVGFCWDSGHEMCYNHSKDLLGRFGDRLLMTHLNDNLGISRYDGVTFWTDDLHLLPFDGIADWSYNTERLRRAKRLDILNFELTVHSKPGRHDNDAYAAMPPAVYFATAYQRACRIAYAYSIDPER